MGTDAFGRRFEVGQIRRVHIAHTCDTLVRLDKMEPKTGRRQNYAIWECEDLRTGHTRSVSERYFSDKIYNAMEVLAWASK